MNEILLELLSRLEAIEDEHGEVSDSVVRDAMGDAVFDGFIRPQSGYVLPHEFRMFTDEGNRRVREVLEWFLASVRFIGERTESGESTGLDTFHKRLAAFQNDSIQTAGRKSYYDDYFGWSNPELFDEVGNVIRLH